MFRALLLASAILAVQAPVLRFDRWVENDLPPIPHPQLGGMKVHFVGMKDRPAGKILGPIASGEISEEHAASFGFQQAPQRYPSRIGSCPQVLQAAVVQLVSEARAKGADAVVDIYSDTHEPMRPSYLCIVKRPRIVSQNMREHLFVSLHGTMVKLD